MVLPESHSESGGASALPVLLQAYAGGGVFSAWNSPPDMPVPPVQSPGASVRPRPVVSSSPMGNCRVREKFYEVTGSVVLRR